jgi:hypothetical protein
MVETVGYMYWNHPEWLKEPVRGYTPNPDWMEEGTQIIPLVRQSDYEALARKCEALELGWKEAISVANARQAELGLLAAASGDSRALLKEVRDDLEEVLGNELSRTDTRSKIIARIDARLASGGEVE